MEAPCTEKKITKPLICLPAVPPKIYHEFRDQKPEV